MVKEDESMGLLIENTVTLQRVLTDVTISLNQVTKELRQLIELFKEAGKTIGEDKASQLVAHEDSKVMANKLDALLENNKTIAKGLILLESSIKEKERAKEYQFKA